MQVQVEIITPAVAEQMLKANVHNRDVRKRHVSMLAAAMQRGEWVENGDSIKFSKDGTLLDGQHRLMAVVESGIPITAPVVRDLEGNAQLTMDTGAKRKFADALKLQGETNTNTLAGALAILWHYEAGSLRNKVTAPSYAQLLQLLEKNPDIRESVKVGQRLGSILRFSPSTLTVAHWVLLQLDTEDAEFFFARLEDGVNLDEDDAIRRLRESIFQNAVARAKFNQLYMFALLIKAWNAYREGRPVKVLRWRIGGAHPEDFPTPL